MSNIPNCPICGTMMVQRTVRKGPKAGKKFFGCPNFPSCNGTVWNVGYTPKVIEKQSMPTNIVGSAQQTAIWESVKNGNSHIVVDALAGTGKTFTITYALQYVNAGMKVHLVAFNKHIAEELTARIPEGFTASTMNSFGNKQVKNAMPNARFVEDKLYDILKQIVPQGEKNTPFLTVAAHQLVNLCKSNLIDPKDESKLDDLVLKHSIELNDSRNEVYSYVQNAMTTSLKQNAIYDYADQLYFIYAFNLPVEQYDLFIGDEIQDWNALQHFVAMQAIKNGGRFVGVGDKNQAIYGFSGADTNSIDNLIALLQKTNRKIEIKPLTETRRCPVSHVRFAQQIVPSITALPNAKDGILEQITLDKALTMITTGNLGIARRNAPLISIAYQLIRSGKTVIVKGRNIGEGLINLINKLKAKNTSDLIDKAEAYRAKELEKLTAKGKKGENAIVSLNDKIDTLMAFIAENDDNNVETVKRAIETLFSDSNKANAIILSSVHRAKGLEADTVFVIEFDRIRIKMTNEEFTKQEANLDYIARTRSKNALYLIVG